MVPLISINNLPVENSSTPGKSSLEVVPVILNAYQPLLISLAYYFYVFVACELGRQLSKRCVFNFDIRLILIEFFGTLQLCAMIYENSAVRSNYGNNAMLIALFLVILLHCFTAEAYSNPCPLLDHLLKTLFSNFHAFQAYLCTQLWAAYCAYRLAFAFWLFKLSPQHKFNIEFHSCYSPLQIHPILGSLLEMMGTGFVRITVLATFDVCPKLWKVVLSAAWTAAVLFGANLTGFYLNPVVAVSQNYGCLGLENWKHFLVYWIGPLCGWTLSSWLYNSIKAKCFTLANNKNIRSAIKTACNFCRYCKKQGNRRKAKIDADRIALLESLEASDAEDSN